MWEGLDVEQQLARPQKPRRTKPATVKEVEALRTPGRHSIGGSLIVVVKPSGSRSWVARIVDHAGKRRDVGLGPFADLPLAEARERARKLRNAGREGELSDRETEVLRLIAWGHTNKEIAAQLGISTKTVETHKSHFMNKLDLSNRADIVRYASRRGWLQEA